jgi:hypothetical protein
MRYQAALIPENPDATPGHFQTTQSGIVGADLNPKVGFPRPEASVFYTAARTVLGPNWRGRDRTCDKLINSQLFYR